MILHTKNPLTLPNKNSRLWQKSLLVAIFFTLTACEKTQDLSEPNTVQQLIDHGWLPTFFASQKITAGHEIHRPDDNALWGYVVPNDLALEKDCQIAEKPLVYREPPRAMRRYWPSAAEFAAARQYLCPQISASLHFFATGKKLFFISN